jgi:hypothetical protein
MPAIRAVLERGYLKSNLATLSIAQIRDPRANASKSPELCTMLSMNRVPFVGDDMRSLFAALETEPLPASVEDVGIGENGCPG